MSIILNKTIELVLNRNWQALLTKKEPISGYDKRSYRGD